MLELLAGRVPVFHTAAIERSFLERQFARRRVRLPAGRGHRGAGAGVAAPPRRGPRPRGSRSERLAGVLGQPAETPHHALGDALTTAKAFIALASMLDTVAPQTVGSLVAASRPAPSAALRRFGPG